MRALAAVLAVSLCACTVGPDFKPPQANAPADWHAMQRTANESNGASTPTAESNPDPQWWRSFGDATLARRRPDIRGAEASLHAATANVGVAVAQFYPDISLTGQIGTRATSPHDLAHWASLFWSWGPSVSLPVFQGGALVSNLRLSKLQQVEAALDYRKTVLGALRDVNNALDVYRTDQARLLSLDESAAAQRRAFDLARDSYRKGIVSFIDVLDAQRQLSSAEQNAQQAQLQVCTDLVALYKALGGGWEQAGPIASSASSQAP